MSACTFIQVYQLEKNKSGKVKKYLDDVYSNNYSIEFVHTTHILMFLHHAFFIP